MGHKRQTIPLANLLINIENPRLDIQENQREAIEMMIDDQKEKLVKLAEDIVEFGVNPTESISVVASDGGKQFVILEAIDV